MALSHGSTPGGPMIQNVTSLHPNVVAAQRAQSEEPMLRLEDDDEEIVENA